MFPPIPVPSNSCVHWWMGEKPCTTFVHIKIVREQMFILLPNVQELIHTHIPTCECHCCSSAVRFSAPDVWQGEQRLTCGLWGLQTLQPDSYNWIVGKSLMPNDHNVFQIIFMYNIINVLEHAFTQRSQMYCFFNPANDPRGGCQLPQRNR